MVGTDDAIAVSATTLDRLLDELGVGDVDYVKMIIEGAEMTALKGFTTGGSRVRNWCISCHDHQGRPQTATFDYVDNWLRGHDLAVWRGPRTDDPVTQFYLFARRPTQGEPAS